MATVYSTDLGKICPACHRSSANCTCKTTKKRRDQEPKKGGADPRDGIVRIRLEKKGRGGKAVTTVSGLPGTDEELKILAKKIKAKLGTGGAIKDGSVEFQGDRRQDVQKYLEQLGFTVKQAGG
jgi:translation initiation factor 1